MTISASETKSGKGHKDENFPVASRLIHPRHRGPILAFYRFVRAADDVADHADLSSDEKLRLLDALEASLLGTGPSDPEAEPLRRALSERGLAPIHAQHLLDAFRLDARKSRTRDWDDLMHYCSLSAMPVGRFVLDVHGEERSTWRASDPLCAALQVINHLQDCGKDYRNLDRVYLPEDAMARHGATIEMLGAERASPALLGVIRELAMRTSGLLAQSSTFPALIADRRLGLEVAVIQRLAESLVGKLERRDPLVDRVHAGKGEALALAIAGVARGLWQRGRGTPPASLGAAR
ncbi:squalene synthase HpnC [Enterovirga rhinocerotis]|uniref:Squalene synthase HpnC n=1 Tax=Enterovirga rhinocerotis TaxID=1339210 RepID=A0A4R7CCE5_9HYPH|nr:squalene synthase HpnC [Enterovirga rhinocerotis]TDR94477.1 squalene synthase HpnC [Enterovirga rhinocerotis]